MEGDTDLVDIFANWGWCGMLKLISFSSLWEDFIVVVEFLSLSGLYDQWITADFFGGNLSGILLFLGWCVVILG